MYISTYGKKRNFYDVHLEMPLSSNDDFPYADAGQFNSINFEKLVEIIRDHLNKSSLWTNKGGAKS